MEAATFCQWKGYKTLYKRLLNIPRAGRESAGWKVDSVWMVDAPTILAAWIIKNIRRVKSHGDDSASQLLICCNIWTYIHIAMDAHNFIEWGSRATGGVFFIEMDPNCKSMSVEKISQDWVVTIPPLTEVDDYLEQVDIHRIAMAKAEPEPQVPHGLEKTRVIKLTREQALQGTEEFLPKLGIFIHNVHLVEPIKAWLNESKFRVLPHDVKNKLACWCSQFWPEFKFNKEDIDTDLLEIEITETYIEPHEPLISEDLDTPMTDRIRAIGQWINQAEGGQECGQALIVISHQIDGDREQMSRRLTQSRELNDQMAEIYRRHFQEQHKTVNEKMTGVQEQLEKGVQSVMQCTETLRTQISEAEAHRRRADRVHRLHSAGSSSRPLKRPRKVEVDGESVDLLANFRVVFDDLKSEDGRQACRKLAETLLEDPQLEKL